MLHGFAGTEAPAGYDYPPVPPDHRNPEAAETALVCSVAVYSRFVQQAGRRLQLGAAEAVENQVLPWIEAATLRSWLPAAKALAELTPTPSRRHGSAGCAPG